MPPPSEVFSDRIEFILTGSQHLNINSQQMLTGLDIGQHSSSVMNQLAGNPLFRTVEAYLLQFIPEYGWKERHTMFTTYQERLERVILYAARKADVYRQRESSPYNFIRQRYD